MNVPRGFRVEHGQLTHIDPVAALFNPAWPTETTHMVVGALLASAFGVASVYAVGMLRGRRDAYHRRGLALGLTVATLLAPVQLGVGDLLGRTVAQNQPAKLAAFEGVAHTEHGAGFELGAGREAPGRAEHPRLRRSARDGARPGLLPARRPHAAGAAGAALVPRHGRDRDVPDRVVASGTGCAARRADRWTLLAVAASGPLAFTANELGWMVTEIGRQPWVIYGVLRTSAAITTSPGIGYAFSAFTLLYVLLSVLTIWLLRRLATGSPRLVTA